ncbi:Calx-beta domain-containing protein [Runella limosa]|uniref:Calx-beta domain-containing protein n=1 Tax=Runella limosa TaxID=370978 RepID=UPI0004131793|nr:Calx-beta domain-containing protein [Runella limosa]
MKNAIPITVSLLLSVLIPFFSRPEEKYQLNTATVSKEQMAKGNIKANLNTRRKVPILSPLAPPPNETNVAAQVKTWWLAPSISALKTATQVGTDVGTTGPTPGDVLEYTITIANASTVDDATGVKFTDTVDPNTTLVPGSVNSSPIAVNDSYSTVGNVSIEVPVGTGMLANEVNLDGEPLQVTGIDASLTQGNVTHNSNGSFTFNPAPGFEGQTTFLYTVTDGTFSVTGKVTITVTGMIWFVNASASTNGDGRLNSPFNNMNAFNGSALDGTGDNIFVYTGTYTNTTSTVLLAQQNLIGQGAVGDNLAALAGVTFSVHPPMGGVSIPSINGTRPIINQAGNTINMQSNNEVRGVNINNTGGTALQGNGFSTAVVREVSITNTGGTAVNFNSGALNAIIQSVSSSNAAVGIKLTATTGSFQVTGTGTTDASGGTLSSITGYGVELRNVTNITLKNMNLPSANTTSDGGSDGACDENDVDACFAAIYMNIASTVSLDNIDIGATEEHGIMGLSVSNLTINNCTATNNGNLNEENALKFRNLSGTCSITNSSFQNSAFRICHIINTTGNLTLTVNNCTLNNTASSPVGADCFEMRTQGTATATVTLTNNLFQRARSKGVQVFAEDNSTMNFNMTGCSVQRFGGAMAGVEVGSNGTTATMNYNVNNNSVIESSGEVAFLASTFSTSDLNGRTNNNTSITNNNSTATIFAGVRVLHENNGQAILEFKNNPSIVTSNTDLPIDFTAVNASTASGRLDVTFESNNVTNSTTTVAGLEGVMLTLGDNVGGDANTMCGHIRSNALTLPTGYPRAFRVRHFNSTVVMLQGPGSGSDIAANWSGNSNSNTNGTTTAYGPNTTGVTFGVTCNVPSHAPVRIAVEPLAIDRPQTETAEVAQVVEVSKQEIDNQATAPTAEAIQEALDETARKSVVLSGDQVSVGGVSGFLLPAEKSITIKFRVTIDDPLPLGKCQISNQGTVTGSNFGDVLTDEVAGAPISATVTQLMKHSLGNLVYQDVNKNSLFDGGDLGINGVLVNLYRDNGSTPGSLDAGDTYITNTTTAGGGLYNFPNLCSDKYIVQIPSSEFGAGKPLNGLISSPGGIAPDPENNTDNDDNGQDAINSSIASQAITLNYTGGAVENNTTLDFGFRTPTLITINDVTKSEGSGGGTTVFAFTVNRSDNSGTFGLTVNTAAVSANNGDYTAISNGTVSFTAGDNLNATVSVTVNSDDIVELNETFNVVLSGAPDGVIITDATGVGTITNDDQATLTVGDVSNSEGNSGTTIFTFTVTADKVVDVPYTVNIATANGTATVAGLDYNANNATLSFTGNAGESHTFEVTVNGDVLVEPNENFSVAFSSLAASGRDIIHSDIGIGSISNDDNAAITINDVSQTEGNSGTTNFVFTVSLSNPVSATVSVDYATAPGTATAGTDYTTTNGTLTFAAGETTKTISVPVIGDAVGEANETFFVNLSNRVSTLSSNITISDAQGLGTINDDDLQFSINDVTANEGNSGTTNFTFTVHRTSTATAETINYATADNTATTADNDYTSTSGTLTFAAGEADKTVTVAVNGDNKVEPNESFFVNLSAPSNGAISDGQGQGTITNEDFATLTFSTVAAQNEGALGTVAYAYDLTLDKEVVGGFTVNYNTNNGTATTADGDYQDNDGSITFTGTAGEKHTITVLVNGDLKVELDEEFTVVIGSISGTLSSSVSLSGSPTRTATITNDDAATVSLVGNVSQSEAVTPQVFTVSLSNPVDVDVTLNFATTDVTTTSADYTSVNQTVTFTAGSTTAQTVNVAVTNDNIVEPNETFNVTLSSLSASGRSVSLGATTTGTGTITNDDNATVTLTGAIAQAEGNSGTVDYSFTATLNNPVQGGLTVTYNTNDGTATVTDNDYIDNDGSLTFAGVASETKTIIVKVNGDLKIENNENFVVALGVITSAPSGVTVGGTSQTGTINNDELDWGDAPTTGQSGFASSYPTTLTDNGAHHTLTPGGVFLGATVTADLDGQPTATANGDATGDDGVTLPSAFIINTTGSVTVTASAVSKLDAWIDFNRDGDWDDANEKVANGANLVAGANTIPVNVPAGAILGTSFARFRVSTAGGLSPTGFAADGEVEDYQVSILNNQFSINDVSITEGNSGTTNLTYTINRTSNATASSVSYAITGGTATSGSDYQTFALGTINFTAGGSLTQTISVVVNGDVVVEDNETVIVTLSNPTNGAISTATGTGTINNDDAATLTLTGGVAKNEGNSGNTAYTFTATLSAPVQGGFEVAYATGNGTATVGTDYTDNDGSLTFTGTAGETRTWTVDVLGDNLVEATETFEAALGAISATSATQAAVIAIAGTPQTATITNDDQATVSLAGNVSQSEAVTPQVFTVTLSNPVDINVTVNFSTSDGTATTADNDYTAVTNQTVTFTAGSTTAQTVNVAITPDTKVEANEIFNVALNSLSAPSRNVILGTATGTGTINNDDASTVTLTGGTSKPETNTGTVAYTFTATLTNAVQGGFTVVYTTSDGTATVADNDYVDNDGTLTFAGTANETKTITVQANGDLKIETNEDFVVALGAISGAPSGVTVGGTSQTSTIENDELDWGDAPDSYKTLSASNGPRHANAPGGIHLGLVVDADLDGQPNPTATGDGTDDDGVTLPSVLVLNTTASVVVNASAAGNLDAWVDFDNNGTFEVSEKIFISTPVSAGVNNLTFPVPAGATPSNSFARFRISSTGGLSPEGLAIDGEVEDYAIQIVNTQFSINDVTITEGNSGTTNLTFTIIRTVNANACSVKYGITGGTATSGTDYQTFADGTASFTAGGAFSQTITVVLNGDNTVELDETILMTLSDPINAAILDGSGTGTITNDDASVLTVSSPSVFEGSTGTTTMTFNLNLSNPSDATVVVNYATVDGTATIADNDYVSTSGTLTFAAGETTKTVTVTINGDCKDEVNETLLLRLSSLNASGRNVSLSGGGATLDGTGTIVNTPLPTATIAGTTTVCLTGAAPMVTFTGANGTSPYTFNYQINGTPQTSLVSTGNTATTTAPTSVPGIYTYTLVSVSDANGCSSNVGTSVTVTVQGKPEISLSTQQQILNEGNTQTFCDIDANPVNSLAFTVLTSCVVGNPVWRVQVGSGAWSAWSSTAPVSQSSNNQPHHYQAACDASCPTTYTGIITLTINYRASIPQNVSLVSDGVTVAAGESKVLCDLPGTNITFNATCAAGEIILYSVDGDSYSTTVPTQLVDGLVHNYRVRCRKADGTPSCVETESAPMSLRTVTTLATPVVSLNSTSSCGGAVPMTSTSTCVGTTTIWFNAATNVALPSLPAMSPTTTTSYYARCQTDAGCLSEKSNVVTFTVAPVNTAPAVSVSNTIVCTGTSVTVSANCPAGSKAFWNTGVNENSFQVAFSNATQQSYWAKCIFTDGCQSTESVRMTVIWKAFELTLINIGQTKSGIKAANDKSLWTSQFITRDGGPELEFSTQTNPTLYYVENVNKTAPRFWTIFADVCDLGTNGSLTFDMLATPEVGVPRSLNTHENNAPYFMYANREGWTELYAQNHPAYGFYEDNGAGGNTYDTGLPKGLYKLGVRYWDQKGWGSIYPSTRKPQGNVLTYQEYWFRIQSRDGVGVGGVRTAVSDNGQQMTDHASFATVMPNPVSKILRLKVANSKGKEVKATLMDAAGRTVQNRLFVAETNAHQEEFDVNDLPNGMYLLKVATSEKQATLKVVKVE